MPVITTSEPKLPLMVVEQPQPPSFLNWKDAEALVKQGFATTRIEFSLKQVNNLLSENFTVTENLNKLYYLIRKPWTNGKISALALSYYHPLYIVVDGGGTVLRMIKGKVEKAQAPGAMEFRYFGLILRKSKPLKPHEKSMSVYNGPYTDDNVRTRTAYFNYQRKKREV